MSGEVLRSDSLPGSEESPLIKRPTENAEIDLVKTPQFQESGSEESPLSQSQPVHMRISFMDSAGNKEPLADGTMGGTVESPQLNVQHHNLGSPTLRRADLRDEEGEVLIGKVDKRKRRRRRKAKREPSELTEIFTPEVQSKEADKTQAELPEVGEEINCLTARTSLVLPFVLKLNGEHRKTPWEWINEQRQRTFIDKTGKKVPLWVYKDKLPNEVSDFNPQFRQVLGWKDKEKSSQRAQTWACQRLRLTPEALSSVFSNAKLVTIQGDLVSYEAEIEGIELLVYPLGSAIFVFNINWLPNKEGNRLALTDFRTLIFVSKYVHKINQLVLGWNFYDPDMDDLPSTHRAEYGEEMFAARYYPDKTVSLCQIGNWLLSAPTTLLLDQVRHAYHHSTVVVNKSLPTEVLQEYLYHLRHAFGQKNRPPPNSEYHLSPVIVLRMNRYIGMSREGTICLSWPTDIDDPNDFELTRWHNKFQGIYLLLSLHAHGERSVLYELGELAASQADNLSLVSAETNFLQMKQSRQTLRELAAIMVRYTLAMSSDDCGGSSEYSEFFTTLRKVFGIRELRDELSQELKDVLAVIEANYLEEERRQRDEIESARRKNRERQMTLAQQRERSDNQLGLFLSITSSFFLPFLLISAIFGMNLKTLPDVNFWGLMGITLSVSIVIFGLLVWWRFKLQKKIPPHFENPT